MSASGYGFVAGGRLILPSHGDSLRFSRLLLIYQYELSNGIHGLIEAMTSEVRATHHPIDVPARFLVVVKVTQDVEVICLTAPE